MGSFPANFSPLLISRSSCPPAQAEAKAKAKQKAKQKQKPMTMKVKQPPNLLLTAVSLLLPLLQTAIAASSDARSIIIANESSRRVEVHWVDPVSGEMVIQSEPDILDGASLNLDSYVGHTFEVRELPSSKTGYCGDPSNEATVGTICRMGTFTVNENDQQSTFSH